MDTQEISERVKQYFAPGQFATSGERLRAANFADVEEIVEKYPIAVKDARLLYPGIEADDYEWVSGALGLTVDMMGMLDAKILLNQYPEIFLFSSFCCWGYYNHMQETDPYYTQRQYTTVINTLSSVGYGQVECESLINRFHLPPPVRELLLRQYRSSLEDGPLVVYPLNAQAQGLSLH